MYCIEHYWDDGMGNLHTTEEIIFTTDIDEAIDEYDYMRKNKRSDDVVEISEV